MLMFEINYCDTIHIQIQLIFCNMNKTIISKLIPVIFLIAIKWLMCTVELKST